ncbi:unnamed protein product [Toxocara canis]|nr:unnamed protein product [Toxocara canis]
MQRIPIAQLRVAVFRRQQPASLFAHLAFGILIGAVIGLSARYEYEWDVRSFGDSVELAEPLKGNLSAEDVYVRCVIVVYKNRDKKSHYINAIKDTYASRCNRTLYFMDSKKLQDEFAEELPTVYVNTWQTAYYWNFYRHLLHYVSTNLLQDNESPLRKGITGWTIIGDEQMYVVVENLRKYLMKMDHQKALLLGRITQTRSLLSFLFPFGTHAIISTRAGMIFSDLALKAMSSDECSGWMIPAATERAVISCASNVDVQILDPVDKEGMYLLHSKTPKSLVPTSPGYGIGAAYQKGNVKVECCSDEAITFGDMNYKQQRMIDFLSRLKVFGVS